MSTPAQEEDDGLGRHDLRELVDDETQEPANPFKLAVNRRQFRGSIAITGTFGIGKAHFLKFLFALRCLANLPAIAIMYFASLMLLYRDGKQYRLPLTSWDFHAAPAGTWCLADTETALPEFVYRSHYFVVQRVSPHDDPVRARWMRKAFPVPLAMKPWSAAELIKARCSRSYGRFTMDDELQVFCTKFGGFPRDAWSMRTSTIEIMSTRTRSA